MRRLFLDGLCVWKQTVLSSISMLRCKRPYFFSAVEPCPRLTHPQSFCSRSTSEYCSLLQASPVKLSSFSNEYSRISSCSSLALRWHPIFSLDWQGETDSSSIYLFVIPHTHYLCDLVAGFTTEYTEYSLISPASQRPWYLLCQMLNQFKPQIQISSTKKCLFLQFINLLVDVF